MRCCFTADRWENHLLSLTSFRPSPLTKGTAFQGIQMQTIETGYSAFLVSKPTVKLKVIPSSLILCQAPLSMRFSRQECCSKWAFPSLGDLPDPGIKPWSPALQADSLPGKSSLPPLSLILFLSSFSVLLLISLHSVAEQFVCFSPSTVSFRSLPGSCFLY